MGRLIGSQWQPENGAASAGTIAVWDLPLRLFHWSLAAVVITGIAAIKLDHIDLHIRCGQVTLALVLFRIIWGFVGPAYARFTSFVRGPAAIMAYVRSLLRPPHEFHAGHNPLGGMVVVLMLVLLLLQAISGLFANDDIATEGPWAVMVSKAASNAITALHYRNSWLIIALIALHVVAVFVYLIRYRDNLIRPMFTGLKRIPPDTPASGIAGSQLGRALLVGALSALLARLAFVLPGWIAPSPF